MYQRGSNAWLGGLINKMTSEDADFRFMALNDLMTDMRRETFVQIDPEQESALVKQILELLKDTNGEVKNMAVRCLGELARQVREKEISRVISQLATFICSKEEELRDIASLGLRTVISAVPAQSFPAKYCCNDLAPQLLDQVAEPSSSQELVIDCLDVLSDIFQRFMSNTGDSVGVQKAALNTLQSILSHTRPAVRKRAVAALSMLATTATSEVFSQLASAMSAALSANDVDQIRAYAQLAGALARTSPRRFATRLPDVLPRLLQVLQHEDDELRETVLQTLEQVLIKCPAEVTPFLTQIVETSLQLVRHDPNFAGLDNDQDDEMADGDEEEEVDEDDELDIDDDYSDDEDMSWKVRRAAVKTLAAAVSSRQEMLSSFILTVAPVLVSRFSEREESVRLEVLQTFLALLRQVQISNGTPQATEVSPQSPTALKRKRDLMDIVEAPISTPRQQLSASLPQIAKALMKELVSKSQSTRLLTTSVFRELASVLGGGLEPQLPVLIEQLAKIVPTSDSHSSGSATIKSEIISLLRVLFDVHDTRSYEKQLPLAVPILTSTIQDKAHRDALEALGAVSVLVRALGRSSTLGQAADLTGYKTYLITLFEATAARLDRQDSDQEMREACIETVGVLTSIAGDLLDERLPQALSLLESKLRNEITRLAAVKAIARVATSDACSGQQYTDFLRSATDEVVLLVRQSNRQVRLSAFEALASLIRKIGSQLAPQTTQGILNQVEPMITPDADLGTFPQILRVVGLVAQAAPSAFSATSTKIFANLRVVLKSTLLQGTSLEAIVAFFCVAVQGDDEIGSQVIRDLMSDLSQEDSIQTYANVARCIGAVARSNRGAVPSIIAHARQIVDPTVKSGTGPVAFGLHLIGEVGRIEDFAKYPEILDLVTKSFDSPTEEIKTAAAFALGNLAVGNLAAFLPVIRQHIEGQDKHRFLSLAAVKELITHGSATQLSQVAELLWVPLFDICQTDDQATRNIGSECLARLTLADPGKYLLHLQSRLNDPSALTRAAVIAAIRFTLTDSSSKYDELLAPTLVEFLGLLKDPDLEVRRHALFAFNSAAHNKPHLIWNQLSILQPLLYEETQVRPELMRKVTMGPFTVTQDDGLDLRKNAFETMYTLLDTCLSQISLPEYLGRVIAGLRDDDQVKLLCYLILVRLTDLVPAQISPAIEELSDPVNESLKIKLKDGATKQDVEKSTELTRAAFRALVALSRLPSANAAPKFQQLLREAKSGASAGLFHEVSQSASRQLQQRA